MRELIGVDDRADALDLAVGDIERDYGHQLPLLVEVKRAETSVDLESADRHPGNTPAEQRHIVREQRLKAAPIAPFGSREEPFTGERLSSSTWLR